MKNYTCDTCEATISNPKIILKGLTGTSGGILLPDRFIEKHFCGSDCFLDWVDKYIRRAETKQETVQRLWNEA